MNRSAAVSFVLLSLFGLGEVSAQTSAGLISQRDARQVGLQRTWFTQVELDSGKGRLAHLTQHVSSMAAVTVYEITYDGGRFVVSGREVDRFGIVVGPENAKKAAQIKFNDLTNLKRNPKLQILTVPQVTLYAVTDSGVVQAIDSETGRTLWKAGIGNPRYPTEAVGASDEYVAVVNGSDLYLLKAADGNFIWKRRTGGAPGAGPAVTTNLVFVPMFNGAMEAYQIDNTKLPPSIYKSQGRALLQPVYTGANVAWPTDRGHLYVTGANQNRISFRLEANDAIAAPATVMNPGKLVVSSIDGFVYCLQETTGIVLWRFSSGEPILTSPVVYGDTVYAVTGDTTLFAIDGEYGQEKWSVGKMSKVLAASTDRLYALSDTGRLMVLDPQSGSRLGSLPTELLDVPYVNKETDRIVIATSRGLIQCLRETKQENPLIHVGLTKQEVPTAKVPKKTAKPAEAKDAAVDPFGGGAPAAEEPKAEVPPASGEKKADDPFGG